MIHFFIKNFTRHFLRRELPYTKTRMHLITSGSWSPSRSAVIVWENPNPDFVIHFLELVSFYCYCHDLSLFFFFGGGGGGGGAKLKT